MAANSSLELIAAGLLVIPLLRLTRIGYDPQWWWRWSEVQLTPFSLSWKIRAPLAVWYALFWAATSAAVISASARGSAAVLAAVTASIEAGYALLAWRRRRRPLDPSFPESIIAFGLWHNALLEELFFRGLLLLVAALVGLSSAPFWPYLYIPVTSFAFGLYHGRSQPKRLYDTTILGAILAFLALHYGLLAAILVHSVHNACALPLGQRDPSLRVWRRSRLCYISGLFIVGLVRSGAAVLGRVG
jgi:hypothetical protein